MGEPGGGRGMEMESNESEDKVSETGERRGEGEDDWRG